MAYNPIDLGDGPNTPSGDDLYTGAGKINSNFSSIDDQIAALQFEGAKTYQTLAALNAVSPVPADGTAAKVVADSTFDNNGYYSVVSGAWVKDASFVDGVIEDGNEKAISGDTAFNYVDPILAKANEYNFYGKDVLADATWINGILRSNGSITNLDGNYAYYTDEFFEVIPNETVIDYQGFGNFGNEAYILGYSKDKTTLTVVQASLNTGEQYFFYGTVPDNVYFVRFARKYNTITEKIKIVSKESYSTKLVRDFPKQINREDYFTDGLSKEHIRDNNAVTKGVFLGTGYVPVTPGDRIRYKGFAIADLSAIGAFDSDKVFIRKLLDKTESNKEYVIDLDENTDSDIAYIVAGHYLQDQTTPYLIVESSSTIENDVDEIETKYQLSKTINYHKDIKVSAYTSTSSVTEIDGFYVLEVLSLPGYFRFDNRLYKSNTHENQLSQVELELIELPEGSSEVTVSNFFATVSGTQHTFTSLGEKHLFTIFNGLQTNSLLQCALVGAKFKVTRSWGMWVENNLFNSYSAKDFYDLVSNVDFSDERVNLNDWSTQSRSSRLLDNFILKGQKLVCFGDSITNGLYNYINWVSDYYQMELTNLGVSGSIPVNNLNDAQLALIPSGVQLVTITGGTNGGYVAEADITSRDRANSVGVLNYAIDYIESNHPQAIIVLMTPPYRGSNGTPIAGWTDLIRDIGEYRNLIVADIARYINWNADTMPLLTYDDVHPSVYGTKRIAGVLIGAINRLVF